MGRGTCTTSQVAASKRCCIPSRTWECLQPNEFSPLDQDCTIVNTTIRARNFLGGNVHNSLDNLSMPLLLVLVAPMMYSSTLRVGIRLCIVRCQWAGYGHFRHSHTK